MSDETTAPAPEEPTEGAADAAPVSEPSPAPEEQTEVAEAPCRCERCECTDEDPSTRSRRRVIAMIAGALIAALGFLALFPMEDTHRTRSHPAHAVAPASGLIHLNTSVPGCMGRPDDAMLADAVSAARTRADMLAAAAGVRITGLESMSVGQRGMVMPMARGTDEGVEPSTGTPGSKTPMKAPGAKPAIAPDMPRHSDPHPGMILPGMCHEGVTVHMIFRTR